MESRIAVFFSKKKFFLICCSRLKNAGFFSRELTFLSIITFQQLIHQAINKAPANTTEACLQHEITRLTGENFDLREKIENLNENVKRLKRMLKVSRIKDLSTRSRGRLLNICPKVK